MNDFLVNSKSIHQQGLVKMVKRSRYFLLAQEPILGLNHASLSWNVTNISIYITYVKNIYKSLLEE